ncbi:MAG: cupin domain-containing protein [Deltaproteobacteria bacterium]|mgnify:CR=1 FL=1|nr:cupin domain-containing protein [Deltaproteobacteria bacterium]MBW1921432.1 cupin domain-containing protein [Deltaproteobacteria bacterium]MBW1936683.1 cupin domain-containing protein [Deltaproteobacteria bacterium]MBW1976723.1 cupin domain-containing protein [Deltaproteobacteria bacterium]MBW2045713.1 cupin domain-containing protein [Deltaproteobacteria bacterium]
MLMVKIGTRIKENRWRQGLTLKDLSERSGLSVGLLSQIERGISSSSIRNIQKIVKGLGISFASLFDDTDPGENGAQMHQTSRKGIQISVVRGKKRKKLLMPFGGFMELLAPVHNHKMEFIFLRYPVGAKVKEPFSHEGEECGLVLKGKLKAIVGDQEFILEAGDSIYFDSTIPHRWENMAKTETTFISALTPPSL